MRLYITPNADVAIIQAIQSQLYTLGLDFLCEKLNEKPNQNWLTKVENGSLLIDDDVFLLANGMKVSPNWQALQKRIITAGKKTERLLKASKLQPNMTVIDATAGFGHDSLILASTGAKVLMIEQNPTMFILLQQEIQKMHCNPNWKKLLGRLTLHFGNATDILPTLSKADMVYLDPMFPEESYKSAQVGKQMQILHQLVSPPSLEQENQLLYMAQNQLNPTGRVLVKRPKNAPFLANNRPTESWQSDVIRYDGYFA